MADGFQSVPALLGSLVVCERCWCAVPRWAARRHEDACHPPVPPEVPADWVTPPETESAAR